MRLLLHLVRTDVRHHRWWLWAWLAAECVSALAALGWWDRWFSDSASLSVIDLVAMAAACWALLLGALVVVASVQAESTIPTTAFWLTRPLSRRLLLASKIAFVVLVATGGAVAQAARVALVHGGPGLVSLAFAEAWLVRLALLLAVAALASLAADAGRFLLVLLPSGLAVIFSTPFLAEAIRRGLPAGIGDAEAADVWVVALTFLVLWGLAVIAHQTLTRRLRRSAALAVVAALLILPAGLAWRWHFWPVPDSQQSSSATAFPGVTVSLDATRIRAVRGNRDRALFELEGGLRVLGAPPATTTDVDAARVLFEPASASEGANPVEAGARHARLGWNTTELATRLATAATRALGVTWLNEFPTHPDGSLWLESDVAFWEVTRRLANPVSVRMTADVDVTGVTLLARLPLRSGATAYAGAARVSIVKFDATDPTTPLLVRVTRPALVFAQTPGPRPVLLVVNRSRREAVVGEAHGLNTLHIFVSAVQSVRIAFGLRRDEVHQVRLEEDWIAGAELCVFVAHTTVVPREAVAPGVRIGGVPHASAGLTTPRS